ncbi:HD-GYP domain-containing protein [Aliikangiella sp. G2MR2-5]|uniref:HD-GYP domain-containing protein n=1 Tax=Aliikangiella sp. G2MR2-5 TaxID=2788943 RepID=UPI0018ABCD81|nr:HD domain-containing phosphohydrolase [Aliikangiella sp. G2MR2-5]
MSQLHESNVDSMAHTEPGSRSGLMSETTELAETSMPAVLWLIGDFDQLFERISIDELEKRLRLHLGSNAVTLKRTLEHKLENDCLICPKNQFSILISNLRHPEKLDLFPSALTFYISCNDLDLSNDLDTANDIESSITSHSEMNLQLNPEQKKQRNEHSVAPDLIIGNSVLTPDNLEKAVATAYQLLNNKYRLNLLEKNIVSIADERKELAKIGVALSAERDLDKLLTMVLEEGRKLGNCEAASLYLLKDENTSEPKLLFKLTQNSQIDFHFTEKQFPLTHRSLAGYVALTGEVLNIADAYQLSANSPYEFDKRFDESTGYRTHQLLVIPMRNHRGKIIGVLQFINNRDAEEKALLHKGFDQEREDLLLSLASQAAVAIDNSQLIENIQVLFEGFVSASVKAIESRDPVTSGHSFRVAELTTELAKALDSHQAGKYRDLSFDSSQIREIRYASLLHDFGKVGVKEDVLLKPNKLHASRLSYLELKMEWQKQILQRKFFQEIVTRKDPELLKSWSSSSEYDQVKKQLKLLDEYRNVLKQANKPSLLEEEIAEELAHLFDYRMDDAYPFGKTLLSQDDFLSLSVKKGSLTNTEREEIQSHVIHTEAFLSEIPWTDELSSVPRIAASHHEKLDGTGYPLGLDDQSIPIASKIMAIADIYDALTARDRPYKRAVANELALDILSDEAKSGKLCKVMVNTFIEAKIYGVIDKTK